MARTLATYIFVFLTFIVTLTLGQDKTPTATFNMTEQEKPGYFIGSLSSVDIGATPNQSAEMRYRFWQEEQKFSLQDVSGNLYTTLEIDRETECEYKQQCVIEFKVIALYQGQFYKYINVQIIVEDINDNSPLFRDATFTLSISEGSTVNSTFSITTAQDKDTGINGIQSYEINPPSNTFGITTAKNLDGSFNVQIYIKKLLDRETQDGYRIKVLAKDGGDPQGVGMMYVDIVVLDINDNKPEFNQTLYNVTVQEDISLDTALLVLHADDKDSGNNALVTYRISDFQENIANLMEIFSVDSTTGEIKLKQKLIYEPDMYYSFIVEALDNGEQPKVAQAQVFIYVQDAGNNPPTVTLNLGNSGFVNVSENSKNGTFVALLRVDDTDTGPNGIVTCNISNNHFRIESLDIESYTIVVNNPLDREILALHNVTISCKDQGTPALSSTASFLVRVTDYNDNDPEFDEQSYMGSIFENTMTEQIVLQVAATDKDLLENQQIHYEIRNQDKILINRNNGVISVTPFFDREATPVVIFQVLAIDNGKNPRTGTATVTLTIKDRNDNPPEFLQKSYEFSILENMSSGTSVGQIAAKDADIEENGRFTFSLADEYISQRLPFIVFANGIIQSNQALDREEVSKYEFQVEVTDQGVPNLSSTVSVTVTVEDMNDNRPDLIFPRKGNYSAGVYYPDSTREAVTHIVASDLDRGENKTLTYSITAGNDLRLFNVEANTGIVFMTDDPNIIDEDTTVVLSIEVRDRGTPPLASSHDLVMTITYTNATAIPETDSLPSRYVIISVIVVIVTLIISILIIVVIFMLRRMDQKRRALAMKNTTEANNVYANKPSVFITNNSGESSTDYADSGIDRKKKEVSFSLDERDSLPDMNYLEFRGPNFPEPATYPPEKPPRKSNQDKDRELLYDKVTTRLESYKLQQMLMETKAKQHQQQIHHGNPEDSRSETSGETTDSGRGVSEEEATSTSPTHDEKKVFDYNLPTKVNPTSSAISVMNYNYSLAPPPIPSRTYKPYSSFTSDTNYNPSAKYYRNNSDCHNQSNDSGLLSWQQKPFTQYPPVFSSSSTYDYSNDFPSLPSQYRGSLKSRDDDDCSTTTSGSYTLYSAEDLL